MYQNITCDFDNFNSHLSKKPLEISFNLKLENNQKTNDYSYIYCIKIEINDVMMKTFYSYFINEFKHVMEIKNNIHEKIIKNNGIHTSHIINNGIILFFYLLNDENLNDIVLFSNVKYNCFDLNFQLIKNTNNYMDNVLENF